MALNAELVILFLALMMTQKKSNYSTRYTMTPTSSDHWKMLGNTALHRTGFSVTAFVHRPMFHNKLLRFTNFINPRSLVSTFTEAIYNTADICRCATAQLGSVSPHCSRFYITQLDTNIHIAGGPSYTTNTRRRRTSILSAGFETAIQAIKRLQTNALDRTATGTGYKCNCLIA